jgi:hypothetical protein
MNGGGKTYAHCTLREYVLYTCDGGKSKMNSKKQRELVHVNTENGWHRERSEFRFKA